MGPEALEGFLISDEDMVDVVADEVSCRAGDVKFKAGDESEDDMVEGS